MTCVSFPTFSPLYQIPRPTCHETWRGAGADGHGGRRRWPTRCVGGSTQIWPRVRARPHRGPQALLGSPGCGLCWHRCSVVHADNKRRVVSALNASVLFGLIRKTCFLPADGQPRVAASRPLFVDLRRDDGHVRVPAGQCHLRPVQRTCL